MLARHFTIAACLLAVQNSHRGSAARADLLELPNGRTYAGRAVAGEGNRFDRFVTGTLEGSQELRLGMDGEHRLLRGLEEDRVVRECRDAAMLQTWAAGYFFAGLDALGRKCVRRAWEFAPSVGDATLAEGLPEFRAFWNRQVLAEKASTVGRGAVEDLIGLARWAREADLGDETGFHLRRAWFESGKSGNTPRLLAESWGVDLESWIELDLKPAVDRRLFADLIPDGDTLVRPEAGHRFLTVPFWYDRKAGTRVLSEACTEDSARRAFYGLYALPRKPEPGQFVPTEGATVYEHLELPGERGGKDVWLWNRLGARIEEGKVTRRERLANRPEPRRASGWGILILEIPEAQASVRLDWGDGGGETLDLEYLRSLGAPADEAAASDPHRAAVGDSLRRLKDPSGAIAELAIHRLQRLRDGLPRESAAAWDEKIDAKIAQAAGRIEDQVHDAAWAYFAKLPALSSAARQALRGAELDVQTAWISLVSSRLRLLEGPQRQTAAEVLWTLMQSGHDETCRRAYAALVQLGAEADWSRIGQASNAGRAAALEGLHALPREEAVPLLIALMKSVKEPLAGEVAVRAKSLGLTLSDPRDPVLARWPALKTDADRVGLLMVLGALDLGDLIYCRPYAEILDEAMQGGARSKVARTAMAAAVGQFERQLAAGRPSDPDGPHQTCFPVLLGRGAKDAFSKTVIEAACRAPEALRQDALALLIEAGQSAEAESCILSDDPSPEELCRRLEDLMARPHIAGANGMLGLLGRLLGPERPECAKLVLSHLNRIYARTPIDRGWRILSALKSGTNVESVAALAEELEEPTATSASRWLSALGHLTQQDLQRVGAARSAGERRIRLERIDLRRAQSPDGRYGAIGVLEISERRAYVSMSGPSGEGVEIGRWGAPNRCTVLLPALEIRSGETERSFEIRWGDTVIGQGRSRRGPRPLRSPDSLPLLLTLPEAMSGPAAPWGWPDAGLVEDAASPAVGPAIFQGRTVLAQPSTDTMNLEVAEYLRAGLAEAGLVSAEEAEALIPPDYGLTLRYATFASYYGIGPPRLDPGSNAAPGRKHLINVLLILQRID